MFHQFPERNHRDHVAAIDTLRLPIQNIFGGVTNNVGARFTIGLPINERATATNSQNLTNDAFAESEQRRAHQIHVVGEHTESTTNTSVAVGHFNFRITTKQQSQKTIRRAAGGVEEAGASFVTEIFDV